MVDQTTENFDGSPLPTAWANLTSQGYDPGPLGEQRFFLLGDFGSGKSWLVGSCPYCLRISFEERRSANFHENARRVYVPDDDITLFDRILAMLEQDAKAHKRTFQTVAFDALDGWQALECKRVIREHNDNQSKKDNPRLIDDVSELGQEGSGYRKVRNAMLDTLNRVYGWGYGWIVVGHISTKYEHGTKITDVTCFPSVKNAIYGPADYLCFMEKAQKSIPQPPRKETKAGKTYEVPLPAKVVQVYQLNTTLLPRQVHETDLKARVPLPSPLVIPEKDGWATLQSEYDKSVETARTTLTEGA